MSIDEKFAAADKVIKSLPKHGPFQPTNDMKLHMYGLFKQATEGPCNEPMPGIWDIVGRYKWRAWQKKKEMHPEDAKGKYVEEVKKLADCMSLTEEVKSFMYLLDPVTEFVKLERSGSLPDLSSLENKNVSNGTVTKIADDESNDDDSLCLEDFVSGVLSSKRHTPSPVKDSGGSGDSDGDVYGDAIFDPSLEQDIEPKQEVYTSKAILNAPRESWDISEDAKAAVQQLNREMEHAFGRIRTIESHISSHCGGLGIHYPEESRSWWPFPELSVKTVAFVVLWPILYHLIRQYFARRHHLLLRK